jgi:hypothetical protein
LEILQTLRETKARGKQVRAAIRHHTEKGNSKWMITSDRSQNLKSFGLMPQAVLTGTRMARDARRFDDSSTVGLLAPKSTRSMIQQDSRRKNGL